MHAPHGTVAPARLAAAAGSRWRGGAGARDCTQPLRLLPACAARRLASVCDPACALPPTPATLPPPPHRQVFKELQPGLGISRLGEPEFLAFVRLATYCTRYVRLREVSKRCRFCWLLVVVKRAFVRLATYCTRYVRLREVRF